MAKAKANYVESLKTSQKAFVQIQKEISGNDKLLELVNASGDETMINQVNLVRMRYQEDYNYLLKQRAYYLGKALEGSPMLFDKVLKEVLQ